MNARLDRRSFLHGTAAIGAAAYLTSTPAFSATNSLGANDQIQVGMIGAGGRAGELYNAISKVSGVKVTAVADPDSKRAGELAGKAGATAYQDLRKIMDDPNIHAVVISTCNHWHCLAAIWAGQTHLNSLI